MYDVAIMAPEDADIAFSLRHTYPDRHKPSLSVHNPAQRSDKIHG